MVRKGPIFSGATRRETHHQISPHILNMYLQPCFAAWDTGQDGDQERASHRDGGTRERALPKLLQRLRVDVEGGEPHPGN